jgi:CheY-like chemotaxis protein
MMPNMDGWEVLKRLKMSDETSDIPVILISNISDYERAISFGAIDSLVKPFSKDDILGIIAKYFEDDGAIKTALIVDDEADVRDMMREFLLDDIKYIKEARDGKEALDIIEQGFVPDIIYLDLMMPNLSGFDFLQIIKTNKKLSNTKIVVVSAMDLSLEDKQMLAQKNVAVIRKGTNIEAIIKEFAKGMHG